MPKHPDAAVPEREQLACLLWKCDYRAMNLLSGGDGFGDGSVTWNTLQPVERMRWVGAAQAFEESAWLADRERAAAEKALRDAAANMPLRRSGQPYQHAAEWLVRRADLLYRRTDKEADRG